MQRTAAHLLPVIVTGLLSFAAAGPAAAEPKDQPSRPIRWVSAYDPNIHVKPPTMKGVDGTSRALVIDGDFAARAAAFRQANPGIIRAEGGITRVGEVVIVEGSEETVMTNEQGSSAVDIPGIAKKVIGKYGDHFQAMTLWLTFNDAASPQAEAYEFTIKADVRGLGIELRDNSAGLGSKGVLRSILNMKRVWGRVNEDTLAQWRPYLETWGQESGHRWMVFMKFVDRRTGMISDALLGRDCTHYHRLVDTQSSVHDGLAWRDNGDGSFTAQPQVPGRFSNLDLYGMGLLPPDEVDPFFFIDQVPGYQRQGCGAYSRVPPPGRSPLMGTRVDVSVEDVIAAVGPRVPSADQLMEAVPQDYFREVQVVVTKPGETAESQLPQMIAARIDKARLLWEQWMTEATGRRMVVCTKVSEDCGDPRSDMTKLTVNPERRSPAAGMTRVEAVVTNTGTAPASGVEARLLATVGGAPVNSVVPVGDLAPGETRTVPFALDLRAQPCGTPIALKASTQSNHHNHRLRQTVLVGTESMVAESFESDAGWVVNPDKTDTAVGALWERAAPEWTEIEPGKPVQPQGAHGGKSAFVTGGAASNGGKETFLRAGSSTLESPELDASKWRDPQLRYWVSFAGMEASNAGVVPSPRSRLLVQAARSGASGGGDGGASGGWVEIDRLENVIQNAWGERIVKIPAELAGGKLKLRFVAEDANPTMGGVEASIDDVEIFSHLPACYQPLPKDDSGGCAITRGTTTAGGSAGAAGLLALLAVALLLTRRRR